MNVLASSVSLLGAFFSALLFCTNVNAADNKCAPERYGMIGKIDYSNNDYTVTFFLEKFPDHRMVLSPAQGIDKPYGRVMVSMLLTAFATGREVDIKYCEDGSVDRFIIESQP